MADHLVDRGAHRLREAFVIERRGNGAVLHGVAVHPLVNLLGGNARRDALGHVIQHADVHLGAALDALDLGRGLQQIARGNLLAGLGELFQALVEIEVAFLVFLAAAEANLLVCFGGFIARRDEGLVRLYRSVAGISRAR